MQSSPSIPCFLLNSVSSIVINATQWNEDTLRDVIISFTKLEQVADSMFKKIEELGGISPDFTAVAGYSSSLREVQPIENYFRENLHIGEPLVRQIGCVIGTHTGPGAFGIAFFDKELTLE